MKNNFNYLVEQFMAANGIKDINDIDIRSQAFLQEFKEWITKRTFMNSDYTSFINSMGLYFEGSDCAEVGKTIMDTVVNLYDTTIITPDATGFDLFRRKGLIVANFSVQNSVPILSRGSSKIVALLPNEIRTIMTQNPTTDKCIAGWDRLHNSGNYDIIVGVYGNTYDKDYEKKVRQIEVLRDKLGDSYVEENCEIGDMYSYVIGSKRKTLERDKSLGMGR